MVILHVVMEWGKVEKKRKSITIVVAQAFQPVVCWMCSTQYQSQAGKPVPHESSNQDFYKTLAIPFRTGYFAIVK